MKNTLIYLTAFLLPGLLFSQAPEKFNYQGVARNSQGTPVTNTSISLRISILSGSMTGTVEFSEEHFVTTDDLGLFNIQIGDGSIVSGNMSTINWGSFSHYLQIELDENGGNAFMIIGTSQLLSVPYALYAAKTDGDKDWLAFSTSTSPTMIDDDIYTLGNVGIGSDEDPLAPISLGSILGGNQLNFNSCDQDQAFSGFGASCPSTIKGLGSIVFDFDHNDNSPDQHFVITHHNGQELFRVDDNENVGIGTNDPRAKLHISDGDIYMEDINQGIILKSPNGQCWRMTVDNSGGPVFTSVSCP